MKHEALWISCAATSMTLALVAGSAMAFAQDRTVTVFGERAEEGLSTRVSYRDLNLVSASDQRVLHRRVGTAARWVCSPAAANVSLLGNRAHSDCVDYALDGARPQVSLAVQRAREIAATGTSNIPVVAIAIVAPR